MKLISSYACKIMHMNDALVPTITIYRKALSFLIPIIESEWDVISIIKNLKDKQQLVEHLIHSTKDNTAKYPEFDKQFYKFPSYLRRAVINEAIGIVSSYKSNYKNWVENGKNGECPKLQTEHQAAPVFYKGNCYETTKNPNVVMLKLFHNNDWVWRPVKLRATDMKYIQKTQLGKTMKAPLLEKRGKYYYLRFAFEEEITLNKVDIESQIIVAVDLGLNTDAVCTLMDANGTVLNRKFVNFHSEKDRLHHTLNKIKKAQKRHHSTKNLWRYAVNCNEQHSIQVANAIAEYAMLHRAHCIVFEHLDNNKKVYGKNKQKLAMWRKQYIQQLVAHKAHQRGIRISRICASGTSKLAYDGSGKTIRNKDNHSICKFATGKVYNCDLSASYNIGARYYIREILKPLPAKVRSQVEAKVPQLARRTSCTLSTLINLNAALKCIAL